MDEKLLLAIIGAGVGIVVVFVLGGIAMYARYYRQVEQGKALIVSTAGKEPIVAFTGMLVYPVVNRAEVMDLSVKTIDIDRRGKEGLICNDNIRADIKVTFFVRVNKTEQDVLKVAQSIGCARASDPTSLEELFTAKFAEALKTVGKHFNFEQLYTKREDFKDKIIEVIGKDLNGFILDDAAIDYLEQTPLEALDRDNIMDADGIRKITEITVVHNVKTNELRQRERMEMGSENLKADEAIFNFEQRRSEAEAKKNKEIAISQSREQNEAARVASDEAKKTHLVHHKNEEEALVAEQAKHRGVAVAQKNREREVAVEAERVEKARQLEVISREREVSLVGISRDKEVELQKKEIADVVRARVAVDKTVAVEEETIKDVRAIATANRERDTLRIMAEAEAQTSLVKQVKAAEAAEEAAKHEARQRSIAAEAELETADKLARAKIRIAEAVQAEAAAEGLAKARVKEADAIATEKQGLVEARVTFEKMQSAAAGEEKQGLAKVKVKEADAAAVAKLGVAEASALREKLTAEAAGEESKGLATAKVVREKLVAEAAGIAEKAVSMKALDDAARGHEEFRLRLEKEKTIELETIHAKTSVAAAQAQILAQAFSNAKFNIVGGDGAFFDRFVKAVSVGQAIDGAVDASPHVRSLVESAVKPDDEALLGMVEKLLVNDPAATARLKAARGKPAGTGE
ncbi:MAG: hypothetical protein KIT84_29815 [Labilithrix sp.]|nr:hypothetical protein [Labilithrix sp.]MCW5815261.1 hypothetical protein [Labilithrix sp.]